jgi:hypothetical protein
MTCDPGCVMCDGDLSHGLSGRAEVARREIPGAVAKLTQFVVDNPAQVLLLAAGTVVVMAAARNVVKPKGLVEALALQMVLSAAAPLAAKVIVERGWLTFSVRDADGRLVTAATKKEL